MKKICAFLLAVVMTLTLASCSNTASDNTSKSTDAVPDPATTTTTPITTPERDTQLQKDIEFILDRKIFIFKDDLPELYVSGINDMDQTRAYINDWTFRDIFTGTNFKNISWNIEEFNDGRLVTFSGKSIMSKTMPTVTVILGISEGAKVPMALSIETMDSNGSTTMGVNEFLERGMDEDFSLVAADAAVSTMLVMMSSDGADTYEQIADDYMAAKDYDSAILYYEKAGISDNRLKSAYYEKAEMFLENGDIEGAEAYFNHAKGYGDADTRLLEIFYRKAEKFERSKDWLSAHQYYEMAGNYSNAKEKFKECSFTLAEQYMDDRLYLSAISYYMFAGDYGISAERYREANYLYGKQLLEIGSAEEARYYFVQSNGYKDADALVPAYYYNLGYERFVSKNYLEAIDAYTLADGYNDSSSMLLECYYQFGKQQFTFNYASKGCEYLSKCRGYKDTDEILLSYYYSRALTSYQNYLQTFTSFGNYNTWDIYESTISDLELCENYSNSAELLSIVEKLNYMRQYINNTSSNQYGNFSLKGLNASLSNNILTITVPTFTTDAAVDCSMILTHDLYTNTFSAELKNMYWDIPVNGAHCAKMIEILLKTFTDLNNLGDFVSAYSNGNNWSAAGQTWSQAGYKTSFSMQHGEYFIDITVRVENNRLNWAVKATK